MGRQRGRDQGNRKGQDGFSASRVVSLCWGSFLLLSCCMESLTESGPEPMKSPAMALLLERLRGIGTLYVAYLLMLSTLDSNKHRRFGI